MYHPAAVSSHLANRNSGDLPIGADAYWQPCWQSRVRSGCRNYGLNNHQRFDWNWYGFSGVYTASYILIEIVGFVLVGVIAALVMRRRSPAV
jgi:hypothetical protein